MRSSTVLASLTLLSALLLPGLAGAQTYVDTFGGTGSQSSATGPRLKTNMYTPYADCVLQSVELYVGGSSVVSVGLYQSSGSSFTRIWSGSISLTSSTRQWKSVTVNQPLSGGVEYAIALYINGSTVYYAYSSSSSFAGSGWGNETDWDDYAASSSFPTTFTPSGGQTGGGYYQRLTVVVDSDSDNDGWSTQDGDCDDGDPSIYPGATELCDGLDGDCNGSVPSNEQDLDGDSWFVCDGDCDDFNFLAYPFAPELCDSADNDCDGQTDEGISPDLDGDGYTAIGSCFGSADDCDDGFAGTNPGQSEVCDGEDNDCNGQFDDGLSPDVDGDGVTAIGSCLGAGTDCDDNDPFTYPGATEICDGEDNDCNGAPAGNESDNDSDGYLPCDGDCDDGDGDVNPGAPEDCGNGEDDNCNGQVDEDIDVDGDGYGTCEDCNDNDVDINPGADEASCDGVDTDCDGALDPMEADADEDGVSVCDGDCDDTDGASYPGAEEICDGADNDCDGEVPEEEAGCEGDDDDDDDGGGGGGGGSRRGGCDLGGEATPNIWWLGLGLSGIALRRRRSAGAR